MRSVRIFAVLAAAFAASAVDAGAVAIELDCFEGFTTLQSGARAGAGRTTVVASGDGCPTPAEVVAQDVNGTTGDSATSRTATSYQDGVFEIAMDIDLDAPASIFPSGYGSASLEAGVDIAGGPDPTVDIQLVFDWTRSNSSGSVQVVFAHVQGPGPVLAVGLSSANGDIVPGHNVFSFEVGAGSTWYLTVDYGFQTVGSVSASSLLSVSVLPEPPVVALVALALVAARRARAR